MNNFKIIYKILNIIEKSMDYEEFDNNSISAETLEISYNRWRLIMNELVNNNYISGVHLVSIGGSDIKGVKLVRPYLTLEGMQFLEENSMIQKAKDLAKGIVNVAGVLK